MQMNVFGSGEANGGAGNSCAWWCMGAVMATILYLEASHVSLHFYSDLDVT